MRQSLTERGMTLIELVLALAISAIIMVALNGIVKLGLDAQTAGRGSNELVYQGRFALERITEKARTLTPKILTTPSVNTTGDWFAPAGCTSTACVMYCRNGSNQLIETVTTDITCTGTTVIAKNVSLFSATIPSDMGAIDRSIAKIDLSLSDVNNNGASFSVLIRLGGGAL